MLEETELAVLRFHQLYKELPPTELFPHVQQYLQAVTGLLAESQTIEVRRRLCSIAGHLAGLRAWLTFDLRNLSTLLRCRAGLFTESSSVSTRVG